MVERAPFVLGRALVLALSSFCGCSPAPAKSPAIAGPVAVVDVAPPKAPEAPMAAACDARVRSLVFGSTLTESSPLLDGVGPVGASRLSALLPEVARDGWIVEAVTAVELGDAVDARAVLLRRPERAPAETDDDAPPRRDYEAYLGLATCSSERGYGLAAPPYALGDGASFTVLAVERANVVGRGTETVITIVERSSMGELVAPIFVLGKARSARDEIRPPGSAFGVVAELGYAAQRFYATIEPDDATGDPGGTRLVGVERVDGTGFYPLAKDAEAYVALRLEEDAVTGSVRVVARAKGFDRPFASALPAIDRPPTFALVGQGATPPRCADASLRGVVRCERIASTSATLPYTWVAGLAPTMDAALALAGKLGVEAASVDVLALDWDEENPPETPSGRKGLAALRVAR